MIYEIEQTFTFESNESYARILSLEDIANFVEPVPCEDCVKFFMPFTSSDVVNFAFNSAVIGVDFYNPKDDAPISKNGSVIINENGFTLDFSKLDPALNCFYIKVNGDCRLQHGYVRHEIDCGRKTFTLESFYSSKDLLGNDYADGYSNKIRFFGETEFIRFDQETEENSEGTIKSHEVRKVYAVRFDPIANDSWILNALLNSVLLGNDITLTRETGEVIVMDSFADAVEKDDLSEEWAFTIELRTPVNTVNNNC